MERLKYAVQRREPYPFKIRNELRKNMTNLPERWKEVAFADDIDLLRPYVDKRHRIIDAQTLDVVVREKY